jgi:CO/xanthine dehydrogenase Mo-binding subunit
MSLHDQLDAEWEIEPERYEFWESGWDFDLARRDFLRILGGGLLVLCLGQNDEAQEPGRQGRRGGGQRRGGGEALPREIDAWVHVSENGAVTASTGKVEVGQNARTSLTMAVADELNLPVDSVKLVMGDTDHVPFDMGTFGSRTTPTMVPQMRRAAAAARGLLLKLAAQQWGVDQGSLEMAGGKVTNPSTGKSVGFGELTKGRKLVETIGDDTKTMPPSAWKVAGQSVLKIDGLSFVTGRHKYPSDIDRPGMLQGKVLRSPSFGARLASLDSTRAAAMPGVKVIRDGDFVGVVAPSEHDATRALAALRPSWTTLDGPATTHRDLARFLKEHSAQGNQGNGNRSANANGSVKDELASAPVKVEAAYTIAYIAHAPLEPRAAVAEWEGDRLTVWTGTQRPFGARSELAQAFHLPETKIRVLVPDTGSGYGGKHTNEAAVEAARLAKGAGKPVKLVWTREEEFTWAYFRPAGLIECAGGVDKDGKLAAWDFHNYNSGGAGLASPYRALSSNVVFHGTDSPLRQGSYRALAATANHFARESLMDELAHAAGLDPLEFRLRNTDDSRLRAVLEDAASTFGWGKVKPDAGHGFGIAGGFEKGGYIATCVEVAVDKSSGAVRVLRAVSVFDCGAVVNPDQMRNQVEGALIMGLGGALFEEIQFENGKIKNPRFSRYRVPRFGDIPQIEVVLHDRKDHPAAGGGESPIVAIAPAIANAIYSATGVRLRSMPLVPEGVVRG